MSKFDKAFSEARKSGKKEFSFGGKKYHTKTKEEMSKKSVSLPKSAPTPSKRSDNITTKSKEPSFSGLNNVAMKSSDAVKMKTEAKASAKRPAFATTHDRGASGVAEISKSVSGPSNRVFTNPGPYQRQDKEYSNRQGKPITRGSGKPRNVSLKTKDQMKPEGTVTGLRLGTRTKYKRY